MRGVMVDVVGGGEEYIMPLVGRDDDDRPSDEGSVIWLVDGSGEGGGERSGMNGTVRPNGGRQVCVGVCQCLTAPTDRIWEAFA